MTRAVVLCATRAELPGATSSIAGLTVLSRALKQLGQALDTRVVLASDGSLPVPPALPPNVELLAVADRAQAEEVGRRLGAPVVGADVVRLDRKSWDGLRVVDEPSRRAAEDAVFGALYRADLGFVARRFNKPLSIWLTRHVLVRTAVTPNQITLFAAAVGLVGCILIATGAYAWAVAGLACEHLQSVLDGCDGELARVRFQQSKLGAWLDTFVDDVLNVLITVAAGTGVWHATGSRLALACGIAGGTMLVLSNLIIMRDMRRQKASGDLMDMVWWFSGGQKLGASTATQGKPGVGTFLFQLGRRDAAIFLWLSFGLLHQLVLVLVMADVIALSWFVASLVQAVVRPAPVS
ncbi:MAG TPA: CDP-alcohol phosphatidyltransferase family protein [Polyangia bacterium]|nr:CDP-alcohol phosphatidyltransferase family protein [Polyangia bacterium]